MDLHHDRKIFPALLSDFERAVLSQLSTESGMSQSAVVRTLILREMAQRQIGVGRRELHEDHA